MLDPQRQIQALVDNFVADLSELAKRIAIEQIKVAFGVGAKLAASAGGGTRQTSSASPRVASARATPARASRPGRGRRASQREGQKASQRDIEQLRAQLVAAITEQPGRRTEDLNVTLGTSTVQIAQLLRRLVADKLVRTEGARRGTRYFAVSPGDGHNGRRSSSASSPSSSTTSSAAAVAAAVAEAAAAAEDPASPISPAR
jgi:hypothetical protein